MAGFPEVRPRRLRRTERLRGMVRETRLVPEQLILPLFVVPGSGVREPVGAMPGVARTSADELVRDATEAAELGLGAIMLFGVPAAKDETGIAGEAEDGVVQSAVRAVKRELPDMCVITDVCLCEYTSHGHCGVIRDGDVANDETLTLLARQALSHARAGAHMVAPSDMMDGRVATIRQTLDEEGYEHVGIMSYAVKYASAFYGPFREAACSTPAFGDRRTYQMDPANAAEAVREAWLDVEEGADILMVKPGGNSLDIVYRIKQETGYPLAAYHVSGEYASILAAGRQGWIHAEAAMEEALLAMKRAGADMIASYWARQYAGRL